MRVYIPRFPRYVSLQARLKTFEGWDQTSQNPLVLARAGFFFEFDRDIVCCYSCGKKFDNWNTGQNPWSRHIQASRKCKHLEILMCEEDRKFLRKYATDANRSPRNNNISVNALVEALENAHLNSSAQPSPSNPLQDPTISASTSVPAMDTEPSSSNLTLCQLCHINEQDTILEPCHHRTCGECALMIFGTDSQTLMCPDPNCNAQLEDLHKVIDEPNQNQV